MDTGNSSESSAAPPRRLARHSYWLSSAHQLRGPNGQIAIIRTRTWSTETLDSEKRFCTAQLLMVLPGPEAQAARDLRRLDMPHLAA